MGGTWQRVQDRVDALLAEAPPLPREQVGPVQHMVGQLGRGSRLPAEAFAAGRRAVGCRYAVI